MPDCWARLVSSLSSKRQFSGLQRPSLTAQQTSGRFRPRPPSPPPPPVRPAGGPQRSHHQPPRRGDAPPSYWEVMSAEQRPPPYERAVAAAGHSGSSTRQPTIGRYQTVIRLDRSSSDGRGAGDTSDGRLEASIIGPVFYV